MTTKYQDKKSGTHVAVDNQGVKISQKAIDALETRRYLLETRLDKLIPHLYDAEKGALHLRLQGMTGTETEIHFQIDRINELLDNVDQRIIQDKMTAAQQHKEKLMNIKTKAAKYGLTSVAFANNVYKMPWQGAALLVDEAVATTIVAGNLTKFFLHVGETAPEKAVRLCDNGIKAMQQARTAAKARRESSSEGQTGSTVSTGATS